MNKIALIITAIGIAAGSRAAQIQLDFSGQITEVEKYFPFIPSVPDLVGHTFTATLTYDSDFPPTDLIGFYSIPGSSLHVGVDGYTFPGPDPLPALQLVVSDHGITWFGGAGLFMALVELKSDFPFDPKSLPAEKIILTGGTISLSEPGWYYANGDIVTAAVPSPDGGMTAGLMALGVGGILVSGKHRI